MAISASMVKELREMTGAGMMDCKKALTETDGDMDKAVDYLRENGLAKAEKKAGRIAAEGIVKTNISADKKRASTNARNFSFLATKSVSLFTSTIEADVTEEAAEE